MKTYLKLAIIGVLLMLMGCSGSQAEEENIPVEIRNLQNLTVYQRPENPDTLILHREQTFGSTDSMSIGIIQDITVDSLGRVFIGDMQKQVIHVFTPDGDFYGQLGRSGKGPIEFTTVTETQISNNYLYAYDGLQHRVSMFTLDPLAGQNTIVLAKNRRKYKGLNRAFPGISNLNVRNNHTYLAGFTIQSVSQAVKEWHNVEYEQSFYLLDKDGNIASKKMFNLNEKRTNFGGIVADIPVLFGRPKIVLASNNNIYLYQRSDYFLIKEYSPTGVFRRAFYYPLDNVPLTKKSALEGGITGSLIRHNVLLKHMESMDLPRNWPVLNDMKIDEKDRLWVATTVKDMSVYQWWMLDPDGKVIARFHWPRDEPIEVIKNGYLYTRQTDEETGLQKIVRYQIEMEPRRK